MHIISRIVARLTAGDTEESKTYIKEDFGFFINISALYLPYNSSNLYFIYLIFYLLLLTYHVVCFTVTICLSFDDMGTIYELLPMNLATFLTAFTCVWLIYNRSLITQVYMCSVYKNKYKCNEMDKEILKIEQENTELRRLCWKIITVPFTVIALGPFLRPAVVVFFDLEVNTYNGVNLPFPMWTPFDSRSSNVLYTLTLCAQLFCIFSSGCFIISCLLLHIMVSLRVRENFLILNYCMKNNNTRVLSLLEKPYNSETESEVSTVRLFNEVFLKHYNNCLKGTIGHHQKIISLVSAYNQLYGFPLLSLFTVGGFLIAFTMKASMKGNVSISEIMFIMLWVGELIFLGIICAFGEIYSAMNEKFNQEIFSTEWYKYDKSIKNNILIMLQQSGITLELKLYGTNTPVNMLLFSTILNATYSYFNMMNAMQEIYPTEEFYSS